MSLREHSNERRKQKLTKRCCNLWSPLLSAKLSHAMSVQFVYECVEWAVFMIFAGVDVQCAHYDVKKKHKVYTSVTRSEVVPLILELTTIRSALDSGTNHESTDLISGQFLFYHDHHFIKSKENLRFRRLLPLFVPIGVCVTTHGDGTARYVTIGMWRHNQQATKHERNGEPWFSLSKLLSHVIYKWWYVVEWIILRKYLQVVPWNQKKLLIYKSKGLENFEVVRFCFGHVALTVTRRMTGSVR